MTTFTQLIIAIATVFSAIAFNQWLLRFKIIKARHDGVQEGLKAIESAQNHVISQLGTTYRPFMGMKVIEHLTVGEGCFVRASQEEMQIIRNKLTHLHKKTSNRYTTKYTEELETLMVLRVK